MTTAEKRLKAKALMDEANSLKALHPDISSEQAARMRDCVAEAKALVAEVKADSIEEASADLAEADSELKSLYRPTPPPVNGAATTPERTQDYRAEGFALATLGESLVRQDGFKAFNPHVQGSTFGIEFPNMKSLLDGTKATLTTSGLTAEQRLGGIVTLGQQRLTVADLFAQGQTNAPSIKYMRENSYTNAATTVGEGGLKPEASFDLVEATAAVKKIAVTAKITDEMYADYQAVASYLDERLRLMVGQTEEAQLLNGNGDGNNIRGVLQVSGIQTEAVGAGTNLDAVHRAITKVRAIGFMEPDSVIFHPTDWQHLKLFKDDNKQYMGGGPFYSPYAGAGQYTNVGEVWGLRAVVTTAITAGTALVGAFRMGGQIFRRQGVTVQMTNSNENDFLYNRIAIRAEERLALAVYRPLAFCTVTGITGS
jgi:HK97 family phage major capsid protein